MANLHRIRSNFKSGTLNSDLLTTVTTIDFGSDPGFATLGTDEYLIIIIDPDGAANGPEIVYLTAYTATQTTGTIARGKEGTSDPGVTHSAGTEWIHGDTVADHNRQVWAQDMDDPSGDSSVDFVISGYDRVLISGWCAPGNDGVGFYLRLSDDGGASFRSGAGDYAWHYDYFIIGGATGAQASSSDTEVEITNNVGNDTNEKVQFDIILVNPNESDCKTMIIFEAHIINQNGQLVDVTGRALGLDIGADDAVRLVFSAGTVADGHVTCWGFPEAA